MRLVLSPYEISAHSVAAMAALLLGADDEGVLTLLPAPEGPTDRRAMRDAAIGAPAFVHLMEAWRWTGPLWNAGVLSGAIDGRPVLEVVREVSGRLAHSAWGSALAPFLRDEVFRPGHESLHTLARDLLRGGGDPAVTIPVAAALEALASDHDLVIVREPLPSMVARFEQRDPGPLARLTIPALLGASGETIIEVRARFAPELGRLRAELARIIEHARGGRELPSPEALAAAAEAFEHAFSGALIDLRRAAYEHGRFKPAMLVVEVGLAPAGESLATGARALGVLSSTAGSAGSRAIVAVSGPPVGRLTVRKSAFDGPG